MVRRGRRRGARTLGLVLSGGGARGAFQVGVYERLLEDPRFADGPTVLSGTSAGGINAALIAAGKSPREMLPSTCASTWPRYSAVVRQRWRS